MYDVLGRKVKETDPRGMEDGYSSEYTYESAGRLKSEKIPLEKEDSQTRYMEKVYGYDGSRDLSMKYN